MYFKFPLIYLAIFVSYIIRLIFVVFIYIFSIYFHCVLYLFAIVDTRIKHRWPNPTKDLTTDATLFFYF